MFDLGDPVPLSVTVYNNATPPVPANAGNVAVTITGPTTANTIDPVAPSATGVYTYTFTPTEAGRHVVRWVATGANASAYEDVFDVEDPGCAPLVSLARVRSHLNFLISVAAEDEEVRSFISAASTWANREYGPFASRTFIQTRRPSNGVMVLDRFPVISVTSVVGAWGYSATLDVSSLHVTDAGILEPNVGGTLGCRPLTVTYVAGLQVISEDIQLGVEEVIAGLWETQHSGGASGGPEALLQAAGEGEFVTSMGLRYYRADMLLRSYKAPVVA